MAKRKRDAAKIINFSGYSGNNITVATALQWIRHYSNESGIVVTNHIG
jgi:hypothetical protein